MFVEYDQDITSCPEGMAVIPFLINVLPIIWLSDAAIYIDKLDKNFYHSIDGFKDGFKEMYKGISFKGSIVANHIIDHEHAVEKEAIYYSGGVDSTATVLSRINENPDLITVWGSDVSVDNVIGWSKIKGMVEETAAQFYLDRIFVKSNFRCFLNIDNLNKDFRDKLKDNWWHGIQHGIGLIGLTAPLSTVKGYKNIYLSATRSEKDLCKISCASSPSIDNKVRFGQSKVIHEGYEFSRQDKILKIIDFANQNNKRIRLRVCWQSKNGDNCCNCEKCARTIVALVAGGADPNQYGFMANKKVFLNIKKLIKRVCFFNDGQALLWNDIKNNFTLANGNENYSHYIKWIKAYNFNKTNSSILKRIRRRIARLRKKGLRNKLTEIIQKDDVARSS